MTNEPAFRISYLRIRFSLITVSMGSFVFAVGAKPNWFGVDRSPVVGFIQIAVFLLGLALICIGGYVGLSALWGNEQRSIIADIGSRLVGTGYVIAVFTGMADVFGLGSHDWAFVAIQRFEFRGFVHVTEIENEIVIGHGRK